jgi:inner membrane protein
MDSLTHTLTGAVIARAIDDKKLGHWGTVAGLTAGIFPDADFVLGLFNRQFYIQYHRDFTHSLLLIPIYALFFGWLFVKLSKRPYFWSFYKICFPVLLSHVLLDLLTSYGTMIFSPFWGKRFAWDLVFIIDLTFSGILFLPFLASLFWRRRAQWICRGSILGLALYILFCWVQHDRAIEEAKTSARNTKEEVLLIASLPQPLSPFRWANYIETKDRVYQGFVDLLLKSSTPVKSQQPPLTPDASIRERLKKLNSLYRPPGKVEYPSFRKTNGSPWVEKALATDGIKFFFWFARFPVVQSVLSMDGTHRVEFMDVRFFLPGIRLPFIYFVEFDDSGNVQSEGFIRGRQSS